MRSWRTGIAARMRCLITTTNERIVNDSGPNSPQRVFHRRTPHSSARSSSFRSSPLTMSVRKLDMANKQTRLSVHPILTTSSQRFSIGQEMIDSHLNQQDAKLLLMLNGLYLLRSDLLCVPVHENIHPVKPDWISKRFLCTPLCLPSTTIW